MKHRVAVIGAGVSGLTSAVVFAERGYDVSIFAEEIAQSTTSGAAAAIWFPYDAEPADKVSPWALETYQLLVELSDEPRSGISMIELRQFSRAGKIGIPGWAHSLGARNLRSDQIGSAFNSGFALTVPLMDTTIYLDYLRQRLTNAGGATQGGVRFETPGLALKRFCPMSILNRIEARSRSSRGSRVSPARWSATMLPSCTPSRVCAIVFSAAQTISAKIALSIRNRQRASWPNAAAC